MLYDLCSFALVKLDQEMNLDRIIPLQQYNPATAETSSSNGILLLANQRDRKSVYYMYKYDDRGVALNVVMSLI